MGPSKSHKKLTEVMEVARVLEDNRALHCYGRLVTCWQAVTDLQRAPEDFH